MMRRFEPGQTIQMALPEDADLLEELHKAVDHAAIDAGVVHFLGAVYEGKVGCFDPATGEYNITHIDEFAEVASGFGTISLKQGRPFVHAHVVLAGKSGRIYAGHLMPGTRIFVIELTIHEYDGIAQERKRCEKTGLYLWQV